MEIYGMTGEKLGTIGEPPARASKSLPEWKQAFLSTPSVSVRQGIASNYDTPYEDTATMVITAPSGKFVDIRFPTDYSMLSGKPVTTNPKFWAFSGTVETTFLEPPAHRAPAHSVTMPFAAHAVFTHDVDSKGPGIVDEGDMFLLPNGDTMEVGVWTNPTTSKYEMYKEYWTTPSLISSAPRRFEDGEPGAQIAKSPCIVAESMDDSLGRGIVIRVGNFIQGIYKSADDESLYNVIRSERCPPVEFTETVGASQSTGAVWLDDPRNTGDQRHFPLPLIYDHNENVRRGETLQTESAGVWHITEVLRS